MQAAKQFQNGNSLPLIMLIHFARHPSPLSLNFREWSIIIEGCELQYGGKHFMVQRKERTWNKLSFWCEYFLPSFQRISTYIMMCINSTATAYEKGLTIFSLAGGGTGMTFDCLYTGLWKYFASPPVDNYWRFLLILAVLQPLTSSFMTRLIIPHLDILSIVLTVIFSSSLFILSSKSWSSCDLE